MSMTPRQKAWRAALHSWWGPVGRVLETGGPDESALAAARAWALIRAFYVYLLFLAMPWSSQAARDFSIGKLGPARLELWLSSLVPHQSWLEVDLGATLLLCFSTLVAIVAPTLHWPRILVPITFALHWAIAFDLRGKVDHGLHPTFWAAYAFAFLPNPRKIADTIEKERACLSSFFGAQVLVLLLYSCAGLCKVLGIWFDFPEGTTWLHPDALSLTLAENWPKSKDTLLAGFLISQPLLGWLLNAGVLLIELLAIFAAFRPALHRPWALLLIGMHIAIMHSMAIHFHQSVFVLAIFLVSSPLARRASIAFVPSDFPWVRFAQSLTGRRDPAEMKREAGPGWQPRGLVGALWLPLTVVIYVTLAFSRLDVREGAFEQDLYPVSAQWMYFRIDSSQRNVRRLQQIRQHLERPTQARGQE